MEERYKILPFPLANGVAQQGSRSCGGCIVSRRRRCIVDDVERKNQWRVKQ